MRATFGSMVQNGKFSACASALLARALKSVDLPTLGRPSIPTRVFAATLGSSHSRKKTGSRSHDNVAHLAVGRPDEFTDIEVRSSS